VITTLLIGEEILLLLLKEKKGKTPGNLNLFIRNALPSTIIEELRIAGKVKIEGEGKKASIVLLDSNPTTIPILDGIFSQIINLQQSGQELNLVKFLKGMGGKKSKIGEAFWNNLEVKGVVKNQKGKHTLIKPEIKQNLEKEFLGILGNKIKPNEHQKALVGFFKWARQLRMVSKKSDRDKEWVNSFTEDLLVPKIFAKNVLLSAAMKRGAKGLDVVTSIGGQIQSAGAQFNRDVSNIGSDFTKVAGIGTSEKYAWGPSKKTGVTKQTGIGGSPGDAILKGVKKIVEKKKDKED